MGSYLSLKELLETVGVARVYYQPPESVRLVYPCIIFKLADIGKLYADNIMYKDLTRYEVQLITQSPDNPFIKRIVALPYCRFDRPFTSNNLYHYNYEIYH